MNLEIRQAIADWNPWMSGEFPMELIGFKRSYDLAPYLDVPEVKIIEGARRVGKSTLLYDVIRCVHMQSKNLLYLNFEDEILKKYSLAEIVYEYLEYGSIDYLFVDEIQSCIDWVHFVRKTYDRREIKQVWVSGSNASLIKAEYATLLTGRNFPIHIYNLSFTEFLIFKDIILPPLPLPQYQQAKIIGLFAEYMEYGAFPAVVNRQSFKKEILLAYFDDFIYKDIVTRHHVNAVKVKELAIYLATNSANLFSYRKIAIALKCHANTVIDYLNYLTEAFLFSELYKYDFSLQTQISHDKKIYCLDTGLAAAVSFKFSEDKGRMLENIVYCELRRRGYELYFHKKKYECDFVIKTELQISHAIQVTVSLAEPTTRQREINGLLDAMQTYKLSSGLILTYNEYGSEGNIQIMPVWEWLLTNPLTAIP